jgi:hypothetical protein
MKMNQFSPEYRIRLQPNPNLTLADPGIIEFTIRLTAFQQAGIASMIRALFTDFTISPPLNRSGAHLEYYESFFEAFGPLVPSRETAIGVLRTASQITDFGQALDEGMPWTRAIMNRNLVPPSGSRNLNRPLDPYTAALHNFYDPRIQMIVEFNDREFLQGAITACQWFGLRWSSYITDIYYRDTHVEVMNI